MEVNNIIPDKKKKLFRHWRLFLIAIVVLFFFLGMYLMCQSANSNKWSQVFLKVNLINFHFGKEREIIKPKPPKITVKGIYLTAYSAGSQTRVNDVLEEMKGSQINAVVVDVKDYSGYLSYDSQIKMVNDLGLEEIKIRDLKGLVDKLHQNGLYAIARMAVFQDPILAEKKPEWSVKDTKTGVSWKDNKGLSWVDPANPELWQYHVDIAKEVIGYGFDEINLDYVRFPSDGAISVMSFPYYKIEKGKAETIREFFAYFSSALSKEPAYLSVDLFGLTTSVQGDMNIGQVLENAAPYFDYVCPMVYPSHYPKNYMGFANPADHPYDIVFSAITQGNAKLATTTGFYKAQLRPWIQDFNLGAMYTPNMIKEQIRAGSDAKADGYLVWDAKNTYTWEGLR
jgi:hypothetical protein